MTLLSNLVGKEVLDHTQGCGGMVMAVFLDQGVLMLTVLWEPHEATQDGKLETLRAEDDRIAMAIPKADFWAERVAVAAVKKGAFRAGDPIPPHWPNRKIPWLLEPTWWHLGLKNAWHTSHEKTCTSSNAAWERCSPTCAPAPVCSARIISKNFIAASNGSLYVNVTPFLGSGTPRRNYRSRVSLATLLSAGLEP